MYSKCDQATNLWQQLELVSDLESNLWIDWGKKWIIDFNAEKTSLGSFEQFATLVLLMQKWKDLFLEQNFFEEKKWC